ncbi:hypothetical protein JDW21_19395 [Bacillus subtilis]|uniref:Uncharacterized protein n=2 Tax=Zhangjivirus TaxID=3044867 RepID=A0AAE9GCB7_9CAUD|nr:MULTISPECIES: hypothetical protein [Bacillus subtilis group]YP_010681715.1 hypothetical protein PQE76_gp097 [Bacillus phage vB_BsuS_PJN02]YP_010740222.1 hypothetical protein P9294_gp205 [Bacillus phage FADO]MCR4362023.1 hypothetical protein [Bacillus subtilis]UNH58440.1 hypothetical protein [Bacillus phage vB_BsuS_PJN02]UNY48920.1 hypothetical protein fado_205 [Bacillus phage FADO]UQB84360.1 hypothetical protein KMZ31_19770 [Bacillus amyloliquefaciens]WOF32998.1 hypothetical protein OEJ84
MESRHTLNEEDLDILNSLKTQLDIHIPQLVERGVRKTNIEIELLFHIKKLLKEEVDYD